MDEIKSDTGRAAEVLREGRRVCLLIHAPATVSSKQNFWNGISLEAFDNIPACSIPEHEHPTHFLNLLTRGRIRAQWTSDGVTRNADHGPAEATGFADQSHFGKVFRRFVGVTPLQFRTGH